MPKQMLTTLTDGQAVRTLACLKQKKLLPFKNKAGSFLALTLADRSGSMDAKMFDGGEDAAKLLGEGKIISITGRAQHYQGTMSLLLDAAEPWDGPVEPADFLPAYAGDPAALEDKLDALVASVTNPDLSRLLRSLFSDPDIRPRYCQAPAARGVHGAYLHGLLEHVVRQAELAETACRCYPQADRDLVIAGVLLHDIGKIHEFAWNVSIEYTVLGSLQGHLVLGDRLVYERGRELGIAEETALRLSHLILSHHGVPEYGTVVVPRMLEAVILHHLDNLEARATHCIEMMQSGAPDSPWTDWDRIESRQWYKGAMRDA